MTSNVLHTHVLTEQKSVRLSVFELNDRSKTGFIFKQPPDKKLWTDFEQTQTILITEPYAYHHDLGRNDQLGLRTKNGLQYFTIVGIYKDYSGDQGHLAMSRKTYLKHWENAGFTGIGVYARRGVNLPKLQTKVANLGYSDQVLQVRSNRAIFQESMKLFEQTFVITQTLRWLAVGIACVGVFGALMALQFERIRLFGVLRAIGVTPRQLSSLILAETGLMGLVAGILAIPSGIAVAAILLFVVYQRSFGWTMAFHLEPWVLFQGLGLALISALLAGVIPAIKMANTSPAEALRAE
jgi:putative ABC transport system permease protein